MPRILGRWEGYGQILHASALSHRGETVNGGPIGQTDICDDGSLEPMCSYVNKVLAVVTARDAETTY
jgi:hypothetical protein